VTFKGGFELFKVIMPNPRRGQSAIGDFATQGPSHFLLTSQSGT
jgi:hypothetical protein